MNLDKTRVSEFQAIRYEISKYLHVSSFITKNVLIDEWFVSIKRNQKLDVISLSFKIHHLKYFCYYINKIKVFIIELKGSSF